jgi:lipase
VRLHVQTWGDPGAPRIVCLHGVQAHGGRFRRLAEERLGARFHVLAPDLRGHGRSGWEAPWTLDAHLADLVETFPDPAAWIGHSFGGRLVLDLAARRPALVERAVLLDPALIVPPDYGRLLADQELATDRSFATVEEAIEQSFAGLLRRPSSLLEEEVREHLARGEDGRYRFRYSPQAVAAGYLEVAEVPPAIGSAGVPTLVVAGTYSKYVSLGEAELFRAALGDLFTAIVVPGGHMVLWDAFDETADAIERFLATQCPSQ